MCNQCVKTAKHQWCLPIPPARETYKGWTRSNENSLTDAKIRDVPISLTALNRHKIPMTSFHIRKFPWVMEMSKISRRCLQSASIAKSLRQVGSFQSGQSGVDDPLHLSLDIASVMSSSNRRARLILPFGMSTTACKAYTRTAGEHESQGPNRYQPTLRNDLSVPITLIYRNEHSPGITDPRACVVLTANFLLKKTWFGGREVNAFRGRTTPLFVGETVQMCWPLWS